MFVDLICARQASHWTVIRLVPTVCEIVGPVAIVVGVIVRVMCNKRSSSSSSSSSVVVENQETRTKGGK